jgi:CheY-like chemotaxis protein
LVVQQGGTINVKSKIDEGSTFSFVLNFQKTKAEAELESGIVALDMEIKNLKVLVAEDIALNQLLMKTFLDDFGFECDIAPNGRVAIEKLGQGNSGSVKPYDIILMDLQMPEMNGFEATDYIRNKMNSKIPIIALTADVTTVDLAKCKAVGMNDYIAKPVDEGLLYGKIVELVKKSTPPAIGMKASIEDDKPGEHLGMPVGGQAMLLKYTNLDYLQQRTKSNPKLMIEMISLYLEQTPPLIDAMKQGFLFKNWNLLRSAAHKMIPSFAIMGISADIENLAKKVQEYARMHILAETDINAEGKRPKLSINDPVWANQDIQPLVLQLEKVCGQACKELAEELSIIKTTNDENRK